MMLGGALVFVASWSPASAADAADADGGPPADVRTHRPYDPVTVHVFHDDDIHFTPDDPTRYDTARVVGTDNGREVRRTVTLPAFDHPVRITAEVAVHPIPRDEQSVWDRWDRAGHVRLVRDGADVEVVKFMTAYGGPSAYDVDVTALAPLLTGEVTFAGWIDTWVSPAWRMDLSLRFDPVSEDVAPLWVVPVLFVPSLTAASAAEGAPEALVDVPPGAGRIHLHYLASGHCTDGRGSDEFVPKDNVVFLDGHEVHRFQPWRDDCRQFREVNPYCRRWSDGSWSSDYSRSGWCPSDRVPPTEIDLTPWLTPGPHRVSATVLDIRPEDDRGHGYWRLSGYLVGWRD